MVAMSDARSTGTFEVKRGLAEMMKGGVIMDVVTPGQAKVAEDAGAVAVMALERVPADIRRDGGVARMSDPEMIEGIKEAVSIPVMAKVRIGHFVEAQILQALGVDFVDESEVLTPGRRGAPHRQVRVRRAVRVWRHQPRRGAAAHLRGRGDDPLEGRGRHRQRRRGGAPPALDRRRHQADHPGRPGRTVRVGEAPAGAAAARAGDRRDRQAAGAAVLRRRARHARPTPRSPCSSARKPCSSARASSSPRIPSPRAKAIVEATTHFNDPDILAKVSRGLGAPMTGIEMDDINQRYADRGW